MNVVNAINLYIKEHMISMPSLARRLNISRQRLYYFFKKYQDDSVMVNDILDALGLETVVVLKCKNSRPLSMSSKNLGTKNPTEDENPGILNRVIE